MNYDAGEDVVNMLVVWDFISRWWWFWLGSMILGAVGFTAFSVATMEPPSMVYTSNAVLIVSKNNSTGFYGAVADMWLTGRGAVDFTRHTNDVVIKLELQSNDFHSLNGMLPELISHMETQGELLRGLQAEERLAEALRLAEFTGVPAALVDPGYLAPSLGTITVMQGPSHSFKAPESINHIQRGVFAALFMLMASSGASMVIVYGMKFRDALRERRSGQTEGAA